MGSKYRTGNYLIVVWSGQINTDICTIVDDTVFYERLDGSTYRQGREAIVIIAKCDVIEGSQQASGIGKESNARAGVGRDVNVGNGSMGNQDRRSSGWRDNNPIICEISDHAVLDIQAAT